MDVDDNEGIYISESHSYSVFIRAVLNLTCSLNRGGDRDTLQSLTLKLLQLDSEHYSKAWSFLSSSPHLKRLYKTLNQKNDRGMTHCTLQFIY